MGINYGSFCHKVYQHLAREIALQHDCELLLSLWGINYGSFCHKVYQHLAREIAL
jgi:hypothetical protein